jgi:hypothetical protein
VTKPPTAIANCHRQSSFFHRLPTWAQQLSKRLFRPFLVLRGPLLASTSAAPNFPAAVKGGKGDPEFPAYHRAHLGTHRHPNAYLHITPTLHLYQYIRPRFGNSRHQQSISICTALNHSRARQTPEWRLASTPDRHPPLSRDSRFQIRFADTTSSITTSLNYKTLHQGRSPRKRIYLDLT